MDDKIVSMHAGYGSRGKHVDGYVARPASPGPHGGLVLISGMGGLNWFQREMTRAFAQAGFVTVSPDLFDGYSGPDRDSRLLAKNSLDVDRAVDNIAAGADFLRSLPWVGGEGKIGVAGFCLGGGLTLLAMARTSQFECGVDYYHSLFPDHRELEHIQGKLLCHFGTADSSAPMREVEAFRETLERHEKEFEIVLWEGMPHGFINLQSDQSPERQHAAKAALAQSYEFLHSELGR